MNATPWGTSFGSGSFVELYEELMVPRLFTPWAELLLEELELAPGEAVLDVACGPGSVSRLAARRVGAAGRVTGVDLSAAMLEMARGKPALEDAAPIEYHEAPADRLPVRDGAYDVAVCQQGLQFFPDRPAALAEMRRALRPGGRLGIAVWSEIETCPPFDALRMAIAEVTGDDVGERYRSGPWGFPSGEELRAVVHGAGFEDVRVEQRTLPVTFEGGAAQCAAVVGASPLGAELESLPAEDKQRIVAGVARRLGAGPVESELTSNVAFARR
jgi:ubiquinone/menaquinone biosynthesis C-methylase UbiE